ncbi:MAG: hypothetical protein HDR25_01160 [Lachnospiraceae bacterium]|nr:hypothetical protein [Lachnospiraceae bacterium]
MSIDIILRPNGHKNTVIAKQLWYNICTKSQIDYNVLQNTIEVTVTGNGGFMGAMTKKVKTE